MAPPCYVFPASQLPHHVQMNVTGKRRKHEPGTKRIDLSACELFEMLQYNCEVQRPVTRESAVQCFAAPRAFRRCRDKKGTFTVETTAWEGTEYHGENGSGSGKPTHDEKTPPQPHRWSTSWHDAGSPS